MEDTSGRRQRHWHREQRVLQHRGKRINERFVKLVAIVLRCKELEEISLETSSIVNGEKAHGRTTYTILPSAISSQASRLASTILR